MALEDRTKYQERCSRCSQCKFVPAPASHAFSSACPSIDYGNFHAYSGGGKVVTGYALARGVAAATPEAIDSVFACTMCGACDTACKTNMGDDVEPLDTLYELRAHMAADGNIPAALSGLIERVRREGSHWGPRDRRGQWAAGLDIKDARRETAAVLLHVGPENAHDAEQWPQLRALVDILHRAGVDFAIAYDAESDSGSLAFDLGYPDLARELGLRQRDLVRQSGARTLLTASADAYAAFRNVYPRLGIDLDGIRISHATEFVAELCREGRASLADRNPIRITYHDPCKLGRLSETFEHWNGTRLTVQNTLHVYDTPRPQRFGTGGQYEAPRQLLRDVGGIELVEMERNREFSFCCGAGAGVPEAYPGMADMAAISRLNEARATGATHLVTACGGCRKHLSAVAARHAIAIEVCGIFDLVTGVGEREQVR